MSTLFSFFKTKARSVEWSYWLIGLALIVSLVLSILSWLELCVQHCSANHDYRLFGLPFAATGIPFFSVLIFFHFLSKLYPFLTQIVGWMIATALGAEVMFIIVQKNQIGHWCPVCLSIAGSVAVAALILLAGYIQNFVEIIKYQNPGDIMQKIRQGLITTIFIIFGFLMAFIGISKPNYAEAAVNDIKERIAFGKKNSQIEIYFVTDWFCPSCKKVEPIIEKIYPKIKSMATLYFIDYPIHRKSLNFTPYNLAFLANDKSNYFKARDALSELSDKNEAPTDEEVAKIADANGLKFKELSFLEVRAGIDYFDQINEKYDIRATPTVIIANKKNGKSEKLEGRDEISESSILKGIEKVKS